MTDYPFQSLSMGIVMAPKPDLMVADGRVMLAFVGAKAATDAEVTERLERGRMDRRRLKRVRRRASRKARMAWIMEAKA